MELIELGTILHMEKGKKPQAQSKQPSEGYLPYVDIKAFEQGVIENYATTEKSLLCEDGDLLIVCDGSRSGLTGRAIKGVVGSTLSKIYADGLTTEYLRYFIQSKYTMLNTQKKGTGTPHLNANILKASKLIVPPLEEQERIVSRIEELFSSLDNAVETLRKTKEQLAVYRQAVLESCIGEGDIYPILNCVEEMGQGWSPKCIRTPVLNDDEWAVITTTAVQPLNFLFEENKKLPEDLEARPKHELNVGDILITRAGPRSRCGVCCMVRKTKKKLMNCDKVYRIIVKKDMILPEYLEAVLNSPAFQKEIAFCKTGGSDSGVNLTQDRFLNINIPVPNIDTQSLILSEIANRVSVCDSIERTVDTALTQAEAMRQSILKEAFEGRLA